MLWNFGFQKLGKSNILNDNVEIINNYICAYLFNNNKIYLMYQLMM